MPLGVKGTRREHRADRGEHRGVVLGRPRPPLPPVLSSAGTGIPPRGPIVRLRATARVVWEIGLSQSPRVHRRARHPPHRTHHGHRIAPSRGRTQKPRDFFNLASSSAYPLFSRSISASSNRTASSPPLACACFSNPASRPPCRRF